MRAYARSPARWPRTFVDYGHREASRVMQPPVFPGLGHATYHFHYALSPRERQEKTARIRRVSSQRERTGINPPGFRGTTSESPFAILRMATAAQSDRRMVRATTPVRRLG